MWKERLKVAAIGALILWCFATVLSYYATPVSEISVHECWTGPPAGHPKDC